MFCALPRGLFSAQPLEAVHLKLTALPEPNGLLMLLCAEQQSPQHRELSF